MGLGSSSRPTQTPRSRVASFFALALALAAAAVPGEAWLNALRGPGPHAEALLEGTLWLRCALALLALWLFLEARWRAFDAAEAPAGKRSTLGWPIVAILAVGAILRVVALNNSLWGDEVETLVRYVRLAPGEIVSTYHTQNQQFLYSLLAKLSTALFGESAWALRLPAAVLGVASLYALASLANSVGERAEGLWAAGLLAVSYHHVWFSQNARGYTGLLLAALVSTELFVRALRGERPSLWRWYGVVCALGAWVHLNMIFVVVGHFIAWALVHAPRAGRARIQALSGFTLAALLTLALHAVAAPQILGPALADRSEVSAWKSPLWTLSQIAPTDALWAVAAVAAAVLIAAWGAWDWLRSAPQVAISFCAAVLAGLAVNVALGHPIWPRFFFFGIGFAALALVRSVRLAVRLAGARGNRQAWALSALLAAAAVTLPAAYRPKQDYTSARDFVLERAAAGEQPAAAGVAGFVYSNYYAPHWASVETAADLDAIERRASGVWFLYSLPLHMQAYHPDVYARVRETYELARVFPGSLGDGDVYVYHWRPGERP